MQRLSSDMVSLLHGLGFVIVSTLDPNGGIHCAVKGIVGIEEKGKVYLMDLYTGNTYNNLKKNSAISITAVDEHQFRGYTLKGKARIIEREKIEDHIIESWEDRVIQRISTRVIKNLKADKGGPHHPESLFPHPKYLIEMDVEEAVDLTPTHLKSRGR